MGKNNENKWIQIGNYQIGIEKSSVGNMLVCRSLANNWSVRWRDDTMMFGMMLSIARNEGARDYLYSLITAMYAVTTYPHDLVSLSENGEMPFMTGLIELIHKQSEYEASLKPQPTEEEDRQSIEEMKRMAEVENELININKEEEENGGGQVHTEGV